MSVTVETAAPAAEIGRYLSLGKVAGYQLYPIEPQVIRDKARTYEVKYIFEEELWTVGRTWGGGRVIWTMTSGIAFITFHQDRLTFGQTVMRRVNWLRQDQRQALSQAREGVVVGDPEMIAEMVQRSFVDEGRLDLARAPATGMRSLLAFAHQPVYQKDKSQSEVYLAPGIYYGFLPARSRQ